jgi:hypothetical protein
MDHSPDEGAPGLLAMFVVGSLTVVAAVVAMGEIDDGWADVGAIALVVGIVVLLMIAIKRQLDDDGAP